MMMAPNTLRCAGSLIRHGVIRFCVASAVATLACACADRTLSPLSITVLDGESNQPIVGARVVADTPSFKHPLSITAAIFKQDGPQSSAAFTGDDGRATVEYLAGHPVRIGVLARGHAMLIRNIDEPWIGVFDLRTDPGEPGTPLRARVEPGR